jgi:hypothetical protein
MPNTVLTGYARRGCPRVELLVAFPAFPIESKQIIKGRLQSGTIPLARRPPSTKRRADSVRKTFHMGLGDEPAFPSDYERSREAGISPA